MRYKACKKYIVFLILLCFTLSYVNIIPSNASVENSSISDIPFMKKKENTYSSYLEKHIDANRPKSEILIEAEEYIGSSEANLEKVNNYEDALGALLWKDSLGKVKWEFDVPESGLYNVSIKYLSLPSNGIESKFSLLIDGAIPFDSASSILLTKAWEDAGKIKTDSSGNQIRPKQIEKSVWLEYTIMDIDGIYNEPYLIYLSSGKHNIEIQIENANIAIDYLKFYNDSEIPEYQQWYKENKPTSKNNNYSSIFEAEDSAVLKSDSTLMPMYDRTNLITYPSDPAHMCYNTIGGTNWKYTGQWIVWKYEVKEDGYYQIGMRARQNIRNGLTSFRRIYIDNKVPYEELKNVEFPFSAKWNIKMLGDEDPYLFYLTKGTHEIKMEVVPGKFSDVFAALDDCIYRLNYVYREIFMVVGTDPDEYRGYAVDKEIPGLMDELSDIRNDVENIRNEVYRITNKKGTETISFDVLINLLSTFIKDPDVIPIRLETLSSSIGSLAAWMMQLREQPLEIDRFIIKSPDAKLPAANGNFIQNLWYNILSVVATFTNDYEFTISPDEEDDDALEVWIGVGRDQLQIARDLIDDYFTPEYGIKVNVSLVQRSILEPVLAGKGPDVSLFTSSTDAMNLAMRNGLVDISQYDDFEEVKNWFIEEAFVPYELNERYYALPLVQQFPMMFYRKDIFEEMQLSVPKTWEDLYDINTVLQKKYMDIGVADVDKSAYKLPDINLFATFLFQQGGNIYTQDNSRTTFDTPLGLNAFITWTDLYTKRGFPVEYDFYNRFRRGEMPIGIAPYTYYTLFEVAAPEIKNMWEMVPVVGTKSNDNTINNTVTSNFKRGAIILKDAKNKDAAWKFVKWFGSTDIQYKFGMAVENLLGPLGRYAPANIEALKKMPWNKNELEMLLDQLNKLREIPEIPGNYYVTRQMEYAFKNVINNYENPRHTLNKYNKLINDEIYRKRVEFGYE